MERTRNVAAGAASAKSAAPGRAGRRRGGDRSTRTRGHRRDRVSSLRGLPRTLRARV